MLADYKTHWPLCSIEKCSKTVASLRSGLCPKHYARLLRHGDPHIVLRERTRYERRTKRPSPIERFYALTERRNGCREWIGTRNKRGYGRFGFNDHMNYAHRVVWELEMGPIPEGLEIMHWCDNPPCVWIPHLKLGTRLENVRDAIAKGRMKVQRGEEKPLAKLTWSNVEKIRRLWDETDITQAALGRQFGIHNSTICRILKGERWVR